MSGCLELYPAILVKLKGILKLIEEEGSPYSRSGVSLDDLQIYLDKLVWRQWRG